MNACELCGGACCKSFTLKKSAFNADVQRWFGMHGKDEGSFIRFSVQCGALKDGKCSVYENRPNVCKSYPPGNPMCFEAVKLFAPDKLDRIKELTSKENYNGRR